MLVDLGICDKTCKINKLPFDYAREPKQVQQAQPVFLCVPKPREMELMI